MLAYTAVTKLLLYPSELASIGGRDLMFCALVDFAVQTVIVWGVSYLSSKTDKTFFALAENTLGKVGARITAGLFALYFIACAVVPMLEQKLYVHAIFYDTVPSLLVFLPFFFFAVYAGSKGFTNIGRSADICLPVFLLSMVLIFAMSLIAVEWDNLLPVLRTPAKSVFGGALSTFFRFSEPAYLLMFIGRYKYSKGDAAKITLSYVGGAAIVLFFLAVFYGIYGDITQSRLFAIAKTSLFFPAIETVGRIDLIVLYVLEIVMLFALALNVQLAVYCLQICTGYKNALVLSFAVNAVLAALLIFLNNSFNALYSLYSQWMWIATVVFAVVIPSLGWALGRRKGNG